MDKPILDPCCDLMLGDCLDLLGSIPDGSIDMVLCDLPYGMTRNAWDCEIDLDKLQELDIEFVGFTEDSNLDKFNVLKAYTIQTVDGQKIKTEVKHD